ncbi:MAG TPA: hypothetical protein VFA33_14950 [Bryobacteraceae bacterium]|nr:hypothetical protein [Bryobacteraceae bacterium]
MVRVWFWGAILAGGLCAQSKAPFYSVDSTVNAVTNTGYLAPNVIATVYGTDLAWSTQGLSQQKDYLPLQIDGVAVQIAGSPVGLYYVSPKQINFLIPASLRAGTVEMRVVRQGVAGPAVKIGLREAAPSLFPVSQHADGTLVTPESPATANEWIVLYALGLGRTVGRVDDAQIPLLSGFPLASLTIQRLSELRVLLNGTAVESARIGYAGLSPGFAGLYQINVQLPEDLETDPEIRIALGEEMSQEGVKLPAQPTGAGAR